MGGKPTFRDKRMKMGWTGSWIWM